MTNVDVCYVLYVMVRRYLTHPLKTGLECKLKAGKAQVPILKQPGIVVIPRLASGV